MKKIFLIFALSMFITFTGQMYGDCKSTYLTCNATCKDTAKADDCLINCHNNAQKCCDTCVDKCLSKNDSKNKAKTRQCRVELQQCRDSCC